MIFWLIQEVFIVLLSFSESLATLCVLLKSEPCMTRFTLIDLISIELNYYPFLITLDKCNGSCNAVDHLSTQMCVTSKTEDVNVKVFNMITRIYEAKTMVKHISCDCKCTFSSTTCNSNQKWNNDKCQYELKKYCMCKKDYS